MAAKIKPIEAKSVHQIQAGQVIVDLCSVVKELVENAVDAEANNIDVRFKNYGLESIEVQDNGTGISAANYDGLALKHYTSKLSTYDDLSELQTFGFRGEALSSLCALSTLSVTTAQADEAPKGNRLEFETSGKLRTTTLVAAQKGTTVIVENLFSKLPVRQKELAKNIKREYGKVAGLLHAYACISTHVKFTVKNALPKGRSAVVFSTNGNSTTRENIANVYGSKMLSQLIELDLNINFPFSTKSEHDSATTIVKVVGHISKPVFGEGRQTPDRQMFFVNGRPCGLPQIAKAINEVYKSYNVSQSPFIFADFRMDTNSYDVNISPDKRTIFLHDATLLTDRLKDELTACFDAAEQTVPQTQTSNKKLPAFKALTIPFDQHNRRNEDEMDAVEDGASTRSSKAKNVSSLSNASSDEEGSTRNLLKTHFGEIASTREEDPGLKKAPDPAKVEKALKRQAEKVAKAVEKHALLHKDVDEYDDVHEVATRPKRDSTTDSAEEITEDSHQAQATPLAEQRRRSPTEVQVQREVNESSVNGHGSSETRQVEEAGVITNAYNRMRPRQLTPDIATITIGDRVVTRTFGTSRHAPPLGASGMEHQQKPLSQLTQHLQKYNSRPLDDADTPVQADVAPTSLSRRSPTPSDEDGSDETPRPDEMIETDGSTRDAEPAFAADIANRSEIPSTEAVQNMNGKQDMREAADRSQEEYRVAELIKMAETTRHMNSKERQQRTTQALRSGSKDSTVDLIAVADLDISALIKQATVQRELGSFSEGRVGPNDSTDNLGQTEEEQLSLTISKPDFAEMYIAGQFNLGFIIALRPRDEGDNNRKRDELFIIDQHASDEKYNFERLQLETVVGNQRLVHPVILDLTAVEEEVVLENQRALQQNGFIIESDTSGKYPVGQRCQLMSLPLSKEVTFNTRDLEELLHLLSETHISEDSTYIPRPSKVRKMFAMRACRSSIMIGKTLSMRQMGKVLEHMGTIDKPWNCPHGRPTMRHLTSLDQLEGQLWKEGNGLVSAESSDTTETSADIWKKYIA